MNALVQPDWAAHHDVLAEQNAATDPDKIAYLRGMSVGYLAAFLGTSTWDSLHGQAKTVMWARPLPYPELVTHLAHRNTGDPADMTAYEASGIMYGFLQATEARPDADVCTSCGQRVLFVTHNDTVATCRTHGTYCDDDCADQTCDMNCVRRGDRAHQPPKWQSDYIDAEFDKEAYYAEKYPEDAA